VSDAKQPAEDADEFVAAGTRSAMAARSDAVATKSRGSSMPQALEGSPNAAQMMHTAQLDALFSHAA